MKSADYRDANSVCDKMISLIIIMVMIMIMMKA